MFIGHFAVALAAQRLAPKVSLGTMFLSALFLDLLWPTLLLLGLESVRIAPGATAVTPLVFEHYPISHSLLAVLGWAAAFGVVHFLARRQPREALLLAALVTSHWLLDALVHVPDLPAAPGSQSLVGLGLWNSLPATLVVEVALFAAGAWIYVRGTQPADKVGRWALVGLVAFLALIYAGNIMGPPPESAVAVAWVGQAQWLLVLWGWWVDRHRRPT